MERSKAEKAVWHAMRRDPLKPWCAKARSIVDSMPAHAPPLSDKAFYRLALRLRKIESTSNIGFAIENAKSGKAILAGIDKIRNSVEIIARFARDPANRQFIVAIGDASSRWCSRQQPERVEGHFEPPVELNDGIVLYGGPSFATDWFAAAEFMREILKDQEIGVGAIDDLDWPREITLLQGITLPKLFRRTYPTLGFGGKTADQPKGPGYTFVAAAMEALGHKRPANETIRSAMRRIQHSEG